MAIDSILNQSFRDLEIIIVDDGSTDNTESIGRSFGSSVKYHKIENKERGAARNLGLTKSSGLYVNYFDSDDLYLPCLYEMANLIDANKRPAIVYGDILNLRENGEAVMGRSLPYQSFTKNLLHNNFLACGSVFLRHDVAREFSFHEDRRLSSAEDWELWLRAHAKYEFIHFPISVFKQVHHSARSLATIDPQKVEVRDNYFISVMAQNNQLINHYGDKAMNLFAADRLTFIALAWCNISRTKSFFYWRKAFFTSWRVSTRKRFWALLKKLIFNI